MNIIAIALPPDLHQSLRIAYPEHDWTFEAACPRPTGGTSRRFLDWMRTKKTGAGPQRIYALWAHASGGTEALAARLRGDGAKVMMLYPGAISPEMAPDYAQAVGLRSFMLLTDEAGGSSPGIDPSALLTPALADMRADCATIHDITFASAGALKPLLDVLPQGHVFETVDDEVRMELLLRLHRRGIAMIPPKTELGRGLALATSVVTRDALVALLARLMGRHVIALNAPFAENAPLRAALEADDTAAGALLMQDTRHLDLASGEAVCVSDVCTRIQGLLHYGAANDVGAPARPASAADVPICLMVGDPDGVLSPAAELFETAGVIQAPPSFIAPVLRKTPELFAGHDLIVWYRRPSPDWVRCASGKVRVLSYYPAGIVMHTGRDKGFHPVLSCLPVRGFEDAERETFTIHYDLASGLDALDEAAQESLRARGRRLLPDLKRLQASWRLPRHDLFVMTRKLGLQSAPRILVLGREAPQAGLPIETNPDGIEDHQLILQALDAYPEAEIIYQPHASVAGNKALLGDIENLSPRVRSIESTYEIAELALVVDEIHTVDSPLGLAAILSGRPVTVYGTPAYAGLGVTRDLDTDGQPRPLLVARAVDLALFVGWHFTQNVIFVDPLTGRRTDPEDYAAKWYPARGEMRDDIADRIMEHALASPNTGFRNAVLQMLQTQIKHDHVRAFLGRLDMEQEIALRPDASLIFAEAHAGLGDWRLALRIVARVMEKHHAVVGEMVAQAIPRIRAKLHHTDDRALFGPYLLTLFRRSPAQGIEMIARRLMASRYFGAALILLRSIKPSFPILTAMGQCQIGRSDLDGARRTITDLVARGAPEALTEDLTLSLNEMTGNWKDACKTLARRLHVAPDNQDLTLRYANACAQAGAYDEAHDHYLLLMRTMKSGLAIRGLIVLELARMNVPVARSLLESYMATSNPDRQLYSLMGDCLSFENDLTGACEHYYSALMLDALDTTSYVRLRALEKELEEDGRAPDRLWSTRYLAHISQVRDDTVETLLGAGRLALLDNDTDTMRRNADRAIKLYPNDMRAYAWLGHAMAWSPGRCSAEEVAKIIASYRASISAGAEDGWWTTHDFLRSLAFLGQTDEIRKLLQEQHQIVFVGQKSLTGGPRFNCGTALSDLKLAFEGLRDLQRTTIIRKHARGFRFANSIDEVRPGEKVLFLSEGGVGDEIRYSITYPELIDRFPGAQFSVDERLAPLYRRSFPKADFLPLPRFHRKRMNHDLLPYIGALPDQALAQFFDNSVWAAAQEVDVVVPAASIMADLRPTVASFDAVPRPQLIPDMNLVEEWRERLQPYADTLLVGVIGTSRILEYQRIANYFTPDQMAGIYRLPGVTFVSLEYQDDEEMADYIRSAFGANLLTFPDLDKMDDFDGVLALGQALDCVVGVNTATIELMAFGGVDTIFAAPNAAHIWRDPHGTGRELFFDRMEIVLSRDPSEKHIVTERIARMLEKRRMAKVGSIKIRKAEA